MGLPTLILFTCKKFVPAELEAYKFRSINILVLLVFLFVENNLAQNYKEFETGFSTIFNAPYSVNSYSFGNNPAFLNFTFDDEFLSIKNITQNDAGEFKKFVAPANDRSFNFFASGKKAIDSTQRFKGSFGFSKLERKNWDWFFTRDYQTDNPFLIGDSVSGNSRVNGILLNAQYAVTLSDDFSAGVNLDYAVDEGLKTVSPRPTSEHRDIAALIGLGYVVNNNISVGITTKVSDKNEQISYREDEGALTQETIILKFKGYDFPNVQRKKVETRFSYTSEYVSGVTFSFHNLTNISLAAFFNSGFEKTVIKDDALDPKSEGFWKDDYLEAGLKFEMLISEDMNVGIKYNFTQRSGWAKYPPAEVLYYERNSYEHSLIAGYEQKVNDAITAGFEACVLFFSKKERDHYSALNSNIQFNQYSGEVGINFAWSQNISSLFAYGFSAKANHNYTLDYNLLSSDYFSKHRIYDFYYLQTADTRNTFSITSKVNTWNSSEMLFHAAYAIINPRASNPFANTNRKEFDLTVEYRIKVN